MNYITIIGQFNQIAIAHKLTGLQMQLWYEIFARVNAFTQDLCISTAELLELLQVSRCQFQRARSGLVQAGLLAMRKESNQKVYYTVQIGNKAVVLQQDSFAAQPIAPKRTANSVCSKAADVMADGSYRSEIIKFCSGLRAENIDRSVMVELETELMNWCTMRKENGWALTMQGLKALLQKLKALSVQNAATMLEIVRTSIRRRWKGFYALRIESKPSGKKLLTMEEKAQKNSMTSYEGYHNKYANKRYDRAAGRLTKYDTKIEDLDFLEW